MGEPSKHGGAGDLDPATREARITRRHYDRLASKYDILELGMELLAYRRWRRRLWGRVEGSHVLELGVGTGKNLPFHPSGIRLTCVDLSAGMMARAQRKHRERVRDPDREEPVRAFVQMDAQQLGFPDGSFDTVVATFVFCSVPDPILGLREVRRVLKPGGRLHLLEHVLSPLPILSSLMRRLDGPVARWTGVHVARETVENVTRSGLRIERVRARGWGGIFKEITARAGV